MGPDLVLNDLSFVQPAATKTEACERMENLIATLRHAVNAGARPRLRTHELFSTTMLTGDWSVQQWRADKMVDPDLRGYLQTLEQMAPPLSDDVTKQAQLNGVTFAFEGYPADLLGVASLIDGLAVSSLSDPIWDTDYLTVDCHQGGVVTPQLVKHASRPIHLRRHSDWIEQAIRKQISNGRMLWDQRKTLFPSLDFCDVASKFITGRGNDEVFRQVRKRLRELEQWCQKGLTKASDFGSIPGDKSWESKRTMDEYGHRRKWRCTDGQERTFSYHLKLTADAWRIYIHEHPEPGKVYVGHVGRHLPIATEPT